MEVWWFIGFIGWIGSLCICGAVCYRQGLKEKKLPIESLDVQAAFLMFQLKEYLRHGQDRKVIRDEVRAILKEHPEAADKLPKKIEHNLWLYFK